MSTELTPEMNSAFAPAVPSFAGTTGEAPSWDPPASVEVPPQIDYREHPSAGNRDLTGGPDYANPNPHAFFVPPQPQLPDAGYSLNNENVRGNVLQPHPPADVMPTNNPSDSIGAYDYRDTVNPA